MKNCMSSDIKCLQNVGTYLKNHVASHPDDSNLQYLNYFIQKLLRVLTCRPTEESLLFRVHSILSYYFSVSSFCNINVVNHIK